ncbi:M56 family metallopeptidase [Acetobacteroides hydrogenigenes]|uniref:Beta-lactamase regulating signal transducer with metallopeptidase domain n=1 Tax=Acetobacteroides hydrogenigenes TaxID=979970 RepID=A0A4R2E717_9BACT|nr:M56 family metallopeptidase [Acetobacteroides hydrogenigenes]TCN63741.1 beta-lactamase regulating signal transducer with metallopeptidase domain [Acetobacteroides hydrogenigenes]
MIPFLLKSTLLMALLLAVYQLFLGREKMHRFSRYYLLAALLFSLVAPFITFETEQTVIPTLPALAIDRVVEATADAAPTVPATVPEVVEQPKGLDWQMLLLVIYFAVSATFLVRFALNLALVFRRAKMGERQPLAGATLVLMDEPTSPFSFLRFIFVSGKDYQHGVIGPELLTHELTHVRQRHTIDVLLVELLQVVLWFNPLVYLYKRAIRTNHEYLADEHVIDHHLNVKHYQHLLLDTIFRKNTPSLVSNIGYSLTKKRLIMMTKKTSKGKMLTVKLAVLPIVALTMFVFCVRYAEPVKAHSQNKKEKMEKLIIGKKTFEVSSDTLEMIKRLVYERSNVKFRTKGGDWHKPPYEELPDFEKRMCLVGLTTMKVNAPTGAQLAEWSNTSKFGLWIDGKHQKDNSILKNYKPSDFSHFFLSRLYKNAQHGINKGKQYQLDLTTNAGYEKDCREKEKNFQALLKQVRAAQK